MKNFIIGILFLAFAFTASAQNTVLDKSLNYSETFVYYTGIASDTIGIGDSTWTYTIWKYNDEPGNVYVYADIDSVSLSSGEVSVVLQGKVLPEESYTDIATATYALTADTVILFDQTATQYDYQYWRVSLTGDNDENKVEVQKLDWKFFK